MRTTFACGLLLAIISSASVAQVDGCEAVAKQGNDALVSFLESENSRRTSHCIVAAIRVLGKRQERKAIATLIKYLDYVDPLTSPGHTGIYEGRPYVPAITALFLIGEPATDPLLDVIGTTPNPTIRTNATNAYLFIYRDDLASGIRKLHSQELRTGANGERKSLQQAAEVLLQDCIARGEPEARNCREAEGTDNGAGARSE